MRERKSSNTTGDEDEREPGDDISIKVELLTKVANDTIMHQLCEELRACSVDLSSHLFIYGAEGTKSPICTVVVSTSEPHSRTCFFDKGTCGVLDTADVNKVDMNEIFKDVILIHSDTRHTDAAVTLAREASKRGIQLSVDVERDRHSEAFDQLIDLATTIFTDENQMKQTIERRKSVNRNNLYFTSTDIELQDESQRTKFEFLIDTICTYNALNNNAVELVVTRWERCQHDVTTLVDM